MANNVNLNNTPDWPVDSSLTRSSAGANLGVGVVANAVDSVGGALLNQAFANRNAQLQYKYWKKMFDYQADYNSPVNQLQRLYDANINPLYNSEYGGTIGGNPSGVGSLPESQFPFGMMGGADKFAELLMQERQLEINKGRADAENTRDYSQAGSNVANTKLTEIKSDTQLREALANIAALEAQKDKDVESINFMRAQSAQCYAYARARAQEVQQGWQHLVVENYKVDREWYESQWRELQGWYSVSTDRASQESTSEWQRGDVEIRNKANELRDSEIDVEVAKLEKAVKDQHWQMAQDILEKARSKWLMFNSYDTRQLNSLNSLLKFLTGFSDDQFSSMPSEFTQSAMQVTDGLFSLYNRLTNFGESVVPASPSRPPFGKIGTGPKALPGYQRTAPAGTPYAGKRVIQ